MGRLAPSVLKARGTTTFSDIEVQLGGAEKGTSTLSMNKLLQDHVANVLNSMFVSNQMEKRWKLARGALHPKN